MTFMKKIWNSKYFCIALFVVYFTVPFVLYASLFQQNQVFLSADGLTYFNLRLFLNNCIQNGDFPFWNPYLTNGVPYAGDLMGAFYPASLIGLILPPKLFVYCYYAFHLAFGGVFMYLYLIQIKCSRFAALCTSIIYLFSVHLGGLRKSHMGLIVATAFLPIILYFVEKYLQTTNIKYLIITSFVMVLQFYSGFIQYIFYTDILVLTYLLCMGIKNQFPVKKLLKDGCSWGFLYLGLTAVQLIPALQIMRYYSISGAGETSYDTFLSYSMHPVKLLEMIFPHIFGVDVYQTFGAMNSSEFDIEIFLGVGVFLFIVYGAVYYFKEFRVRMSLAFMGVAFLYCVQGHIPFLSKLLFRIPIINGFRCSARALFIFIFFAYVLFAITLTKIDMKQTIKRLYRFSEIFLVIILLISGVVGITLISIVGSNKELIKQEYSYFKQAFLPAITVLCVIAAMLWLVYMQKKNSIKYSRFSYCFICIVLVITTLFETIPYSSSAHTSSAQRLETTSDNLKEIKASIGNRKVWLAYNLLDGGYDSPIAYESNMISQVPAINAYISFNNPRLFRLFTNGSIMKPSYNSSGLLAGFPEARSNLQFQNDLLSMLGVKYILDPLKLISDDGSCVKSMEPKETVTLAGQVPITATSVVAEFLNVPVKVQSDTLYKVDFKVNALQEGSMLYCDFYGSSYDFGEQNRQFTVRKGIHDISFYINTGDISVAQGPISFRIFGSSNMNCTISDVKLSKLECITQKGVYKPFLVDGTNRIFENTNAKDILYCPENVKSISDENAIYDDVYSYKLDTTSYVKNIKDMELSGGKTKIAVIKFSNNSIVANVDATQDTFINFSQNYFPGWHAYVDGKETEDYMVNGLIQGAQIPKGQHEIMFKYVPMPLYIGAGITLICFIIGILIIMKNRNKYNNDSI